MVNTGILYAITAGVGALTIWVVRNRLLATEYKEQIDRKLVRLMGFLIAFCVFDMIWGLLSSRLLIINQVVYTISTYSFHLGAAFSSFLWAGYVIHYLEIKNKYVVVLNVCRTIFLTVQIGILVSNIWFNTFFSIDEDAIYHSYYLRNFMFYMQFSYYIVLILYAGIRMIRMRKKSNPQKLRKYKAAFLFSCVPLAFGLGQMLWPDASMYSLGFMLTSVLIYSINITADRETYLTKIYEDKNNKLNTLILGLSGDYQALYLVNLDTNEYETYGSNTGNYKNSVFPNLGQIKDFFVNLQNAIDMVVVPGDREYVAKMLDKNNIQAELKKADSYSFNYRVMQNGGDRYYLIKVVKAMDNSVIIGLFDDDVRIHNEMEQKEQLKNALEMAESANRAKTAFLNNMSHDIRTPMNAIIGYTELAQKNIDEKEKISTYLTKIDQSSKHLLTLINDVLDMSRIESGKMSLNEKEEDLSEILLTLHSIIQADAQTKGIDFSIDSDSVINKRIICDSLRLNQILLNILSNSIKYTKAGGKVSMTVREKPVLRAGYADYEFIIKDTGIGMSEEFLKVIFNPFTRASSSTVSGIQGTGLGMPIAKSVVDMMGGTIVIDSKEGVGTQTVISLCFKIDEAFMGSNLSSPGQDDDVKDDLNSISSSNEYNSCDEKSFSGKKILLVDDNEINREIATELLSDYGFEVTSVEDGLKAVKTAKSYKRSDCDLILMDIQMPIMDGYAATREIRKLDDLEIANIPIIAMTANAFEEDRQLAFDAGMSDYIAKPINVEKMLAVLAKYL